MNPVNWKPDLGLTELFFDNAIWVFIINKLRINLSPVSLKSMQML